MTLRKCLGTTAAFGAACLLTAAAHAQTVYIDYNSPSTDFNGTADQVVYGFNSGANVWNATMSGGNVSVGVDAYNFTHLTVSAGTINSILYAFDNSVVTVTGGNELAGVTSYSNGQVNVYGGAFGLTYGENFIDNSSLTLNGNLAITGSVPDTFLGGIDYTVVGTLADNASPGTYIVNVAGAGQLALVASSTPEPSAWAALCACGLAGAGFLRRRGVRRNAKA